MWQPPHAFARDLAAHDQPTSRLVSEITDLYYRMRFAGRPLAAEEIQLARRLVHALRAELARRA